MRLSISLDNWLERIINGSKVFLFFLLCQLSLFLKESFFGSSRLFSPCFKLVLRVHFLLALYWCCAHEVFLGRLIMSMGEESEGVGDENEEGGVEEGGGSGGVVRRRDREMEEGGGDHPSFTPVIHILVSPLPLPLPPPPPHPPLPRTLHPITNFLLLALSLHRRLLYIPSLTPSPLHLSLP